MNGGLAAQSVLIWKPPAKYAVLIYHDRSSDRQRARKAEQIIKCWRWQGADGDMQFISVKGCGHTIPTYCPQAGFEMLDNWLNPENDATAPPTRRKRSKEL